MPAKSNLCLGTRAHVPTISGGLVTVQSGLRQVWVKASLGCDSLGYVVAPNSLVSENMVVECATSVFYVFLLKIKICSQEQDTSQFISAVPELRVYQ